MPKFFERTELPSALDTPELPPGQIDEYQDYNPNLVKTLITWRAPERPFRKKGWAYYRTVGLILILIAMIALLAGEFLLIGVLGAVGFVVYVLNFVPPGEVENKISTQGITIGDHFYHWQQLDSFWISEKEGHKVLSVLTSIHFPGMLMLLLDNINPEDIKMVCARYLPFHEIAPKSMMDKWSEGLQKHFPLEKAS